MVNSTQVEEITLFYRELEHAATADHSMREKLSTINQDYTNPDHIKALTSSKTHLHDTRNSGIARSPGPGGAVGGPPPWGPLFEVSI